MCCTSFCSQYALNVGIYTYAKIYVLRTTQNIRTTLRYMFAGLFVFDHSRLHKNANVLHKNANILHKNVNVLHKNINVLHKNANVLHKNVKVMHKKSKRTYNS